MKNYIDRLVVLSQLPAMALILEANKCIVGEPNSNSRTWGRDKCVEDKMSVIQYHDWQDENVKIRTLRTRCSILRTCLLV